jgi:hypothetical protein
MTDYEDSVRQMGQDPFYRSSVDWQLLAELEMTSGMDAGSVIGAWLPDILMPLCLHVDLLKKLLASAENAAARATHREMVMKYQHTHLLIYIPANRPLNIQTWGFFRIEKVEPAVGTNTSRAHTIEFYLYLEGMYNALGHELRFPQSK